MTRQTEDEAHENFERRDTEPCPPPHYTTPEPLETMLDRSLEGVQTGPECVGDWTCVYAPSTLEGSISLQEVSKAFKARKNKVDQECPPPRKDIPLASGCLDYFPDALKLVAQLSKAGNDKHNPGQPMHWAQDKSSDHADCILRHQVDVGTTDLETGLDHAVAVAWRGLAQLQIQCQQRGAAKPKGAK